MALPYATLLESKCFLGYCLSIWSATGPMVVHWSRHNFLSKKYSVFLGLENGVSRVWWYIDPGIIFCQTSTASFKARKMLFPEFALSRFRLCLWGTVRMSFGMRYGRVLWVLEGNCGMMWFVVWVNGYVFAEGTFRIVSNYWNNELSTSPILNQWTVELRAVWIVN